MVNVNRCDDMNQQSLSGHVSKHKEISQYTKTNVPVETPAKHIQDQKIINNKYKQIHGSLKGLDGVNDPSAGSPTETLLRLLLPLNDQV